MILIAELKELQGGRHHWQRWKVFGPAEPVPADAHADALSHHPVHRHRMGAALSGVSINLISQLLDIIIEAHLIPGAN